MYYLVQERHPEKYSSFRRRAAPVEDFCSVELNTVRTSKHLNELAKCAADGGICGAIQSQQYFNWFAEIWNRKLSRPREGQAICQDTNKTAFGNN